MVSEPDTSNCEGTCILIYTQMIIYTYTHICRLFSLSMYVYRYTHIHVHMYIYIYVDLLNHHHAMLRTEMTRDFSDFPASTDDGGAIAPRDLAHVDRFVGSLFVAST